MSSLKCPSCGKKRETFPVPMEYLPFCSERCRLIDLGKWFEGDYRISRELTPDELEDFPMLDDEGPETN